MKYVKKKEAKKCFTLSIYQIQFVLGFNKIRIIIFVLLRVTVTFVVDFYAINLIRDMKLLMFIALENCHCILVY